MSLWRISGVIIICSLYLSACVSTPVKNINKKEPAVVVGVLLYEKALNRGGDLALTPFRAGPKAEANAELDHISVMVLKGIKDVLDERNSHLHVIDPSTNRPQLGLGGFIQEYSKKGSLMGPAQSILTLEGELWFVSSGEKVLNFTVKKKFDPKKEKSADVAYALGRSIADFMMKQSKSCADSGCEETESL